MEYSLYYMIAVFVMFFVVCPLAARMSREERHRKMGGDKCLAYFSEKDYKNNIKRIKKIQSCFSVPPLFPEKSVHEVISLGGELLKNEGFRISESIGKV